MPCSNIYAAKEYQKQYYRRDRERWIKYALEYQKQHIVEYRDYYLQYQDEHREAYRERNRTWRARQKK